MAVDVDFPPLYDMITKDPSLSMSDEYGDWLASFVQTVSEYLKQTGIFLPQMMEDQRNKIQNPINGQMIYNTTVQSAQYFNNGAWTSF